jgi:hypothetical protein
VRLLRAWSAILAAKGFFLAKESVLHHSEVQPMAKVAKKVLPGEIAHGTGLISGNNT